MLKRNTLHGVKTFRDRLEVLLPVVILAITVSYLPMGATAEAGSPETPVIPAGSAGIVNLAASGETGKEADAAAAVSDGSSGSGAGAQENETAYRVKPLQEKLAALTQEEITSAFNSYSDMGVHWGRQEVGKLTCLEIIAGMNGAFLSENPVQVDEFLKMTVRALGFKLVQDPKYWAQNYIDTAIEEKLIAQKEFNDYRRAITREEAARIIVKAALMKEELPYGDPYNNPDNLVRSKILDYSRIKDENKQFVLYSYEIGLIQGLNGMFMPGNTLTRAEAATIVIRFLEDPSRVPFKPAENEVYTCVNPDGTVATAYPPPKMEVIDAANAFKTAWPMSKGYVCTGFSDSGHVIFYTFYESKQLYDQNSITNMQMALHLDTINDIRLMDDPYDFVLYDAAAVKNLHRDVIYEMFKFWFELDADKAMAEFDRYLEYAISGDQEHRIEKITYNRRLMYFYKIGGDNGFSLSINSLP